MAIQQPNGRNYFATATGAPAAGYKVYTYVAGTSTPKSTFTTSDGSVANTNPVVLNSRGEAAIYWDGTYDVVLKDTADVIVWGPERLYAPDLADWVTIADLGNTSSPALGDDLVGVKNTGSGGVARTQHDLNEEKIISITDMGGTPGLVFDNTAAFNNCLNALGSAGGIIEFPTGNWRGNFLVNQHNITLRGRGGVGELLTSDPAAVCLRPYNTGGSTYTVKFGNQTQYIRKCGIEHLTVSGDDGSGNQADSALWIAGGTVNFFAHRFDLMGGTRSLRIEPGGTYPATQLKFSQGVIRNDVSSASARAIYVRKFADATGYVTDLHFHQLKVNKTGSGYWLEADGTGSTGLVIHFGQTYVDHPAGGGILFSAAGLETIECDGGLQLDPGAAGAVIIKRNDLVKDPTRYIRGHIEGIGGQKVEFSDLSTITFPLEPGNITYTPLLRNAYLIAPLTWSSAASPFDASAPFHDTDSPTGPVILKNGTGEGTRTENSATVIRGQISEEITLSTSGLTTNSSTNLLPANSVINAVVARITQTITTTTNWALGDATTSGRFAAANSTLSAGTTSVGLVHVDQTGAAGPRQTSAAPLRITCTGANPGAGKIRVTVFYTQFVPPTS